MTRNEVLRRLCEVGVIPVVRAKSADGLVNIAQAGRLRQRDLRAAAIVDNFLEGVLEVIFGRFFTGHRPWRWRPGGFFSRRPPNGKMG